MSRVVVVQKYDVQAIVMRRRPIVAGGSARPTFLLLFSASQVFAASQANARALGVALSRALSQIGDQAVEYAEDYGFANRAGAASIKQLVHDLRGLSGKLWELFTTSFQSGDANRFAEAWSSATRAAQGVPCFACVIDHPQGQPIAKIFWPPTMTGEGVYRFGFFEADKQIYVDPLPGISPNELIDPHEFMVTGKV